MNSTSTVSTANNIDPLLYRNINRQNQMLQNSQNSKKNSSEEKIDDKNNFKSLLEKNTQINIQHPLLSEGKIESSVFNRRPSRAQVLDEIQNSPDKRKLYDAAKSFESFFLEKMYKEMKKNVPKSELIHGGRAEEIFDDLLTTERISNMASQQEFGLAEDIYFQLRS